MLKSIKDRVQYLKDKIKAGFGDEKAYLENIWALKNDAKTFDGENPRHYKFNDLPQNEFTDVIASGIADALKKSEKATALTLFHGDVTDKGMNKILEALRQTKAPIQELNIDDFPAVTDNSIKMLPEIIKEKGIITCKLRVDGINPEIKQQIAKACKQNVLNRAKTEKTGEYQ